MSWVQWGRGRVTSLMPRRGLEAGALFAGVVAVALLAIPKPAAAHPTFCEEIFNPHGQTTPPAGSSTLPGAQGGQNEDGFYQVGACGPSLDGFTCPTGLGGPEFAALCFCTNPSDVGEAVHLYDAGDGCALPEEEWFQYSIDGDVTFDFGTIIKYTEANGKPRGVEPMAGNNGQGDGLSEAVDWHIWGQGDLLVRALDKSFVSCCRVPPPPK
jgi:hypothetical protein